MRKLLYLFIGLFSFFSCTDNAVPILFPEEKTLTAIEVPVNELFSADFMTKKSDYLFMISTQSDTMIYMYSLPDLKFVRNFGDLVNFSFRCLWSLPVTTCSCGDFQN